MIFLTGATGFIGRNIARQLCDAGLPVRALVRSENSPRGVLPSSAEIVYGDVLKSKVVDGAAGCNTIIHLVGIIKETRNLSFYQAHVAATANMLEAAKANGIKRYIQMSALGTRPDAIAEYHKTKWKAEELVRSSGLNWTIFRPSLVYGKDSEFLQSMMPLVKAPVTPIISPGMNTGLLQPIHVDDLAKCFVQAAQDHTGTTFGQIYECGGPDQVTTKRVLELVAQMRGKKLRTIPFPLFLATLFFGIGEKLHLPVPATRGQLQMLQENTICDIGPMREAFDMEPRALEEGLRESL
jgi:NADH dehydrogenase